MAQKSYEEIVEALKTHYLGMGVPATYEMAESIVNGWKTAGMDLEQTLGTFVGASQYVNSGKEYRFPNAFEYFKLTDQSDTDDPEVLKALACGANLSVLNQTPLNSISINRDPSDIAQMLANDWGIESKEDLLSTLGWLQMEGHRIYYYLILDRLQNIPPEEWTSLNFNDVAFDQVYWIEDLEGIDVEDELETANNYLANVINGYDKLSSKPGLRTTPVPKIESWDFGRAINLIRWGHNLNYFSKEEAEEMLKLFLNELKNVYPDWASLSEGYIMGFLMKFANESAFETMYMDQYNLLEESNSPWVTIEW